MAHPLPGQPGTNTWGDGVDAALAAFPAANLAGTIDDARLPSSAQAAWLASTYMLAAAYTVPLIGAGIDYTGATDSTAAVQTIIDANPGKVLQWANGVLEFSNLTVSKGQHLRGLGQQDWRDRTSTFNSAGWAVNANFSGTVLRSTATSGAAITICDTEVNSGGISDLTLIGPGTGTSVGIVWGSTTWTVVNARSRSVKVGNFSVGVRTNLVNEGSFYDLAIRGCTLGLDQAYTSIQNAFYLLDVQWCGDGVHVASNCYANAFYSPIVQSNSGTGIVVNGTKNVFYNPYCENNTTRAIDIVAGSGNRIDVPFGNDASDDIRIQAAATDTSVTGFGFAGGVATLHNAGVRSYLQGNFAGVLTDTGTGTIVVDSGMAGSTYGAWDTTYVPTLGGTGWAIGNGTITGTQVVIGKTVHMTATITFGTTSTFGSVSPTITLPFASNVARGSSYGTILQSGVGSYQLAPYHSSTTVITAYALGANGAFTNLTATYPATFAATDVLKVYSTYERA